MKGPLNPKLLSIHTEIDGKEVKLDLYEDSNLKQVARELCCCYGIDTDFQPQIESLIEDKIRQMLTPSCDSAFRRRVEEFLSTDKENNRRCDSHHHLSNDSECSGVNLYEKCMKMTECRQTMLKTLKMQKERDELNKCTFRPSINNKSHRIPRTTVVHEQLYKTAKLYDQKKEERRREKEKKQFSGLTFQPQLNYCSVRIAQQKKQQAKQLRVQTSVSVDKQDKGKHNQSMFTFCPEISPGTRRMVRDRQIPNFTKRLQGYLSKIKTKSIVKPTNVYSHGQFTGSKLTPNTKRVSNDTKKKQITSTVHFPVSPSQRRSQGGQGMPGALKSSELYNRKKTRAFSLIFEALQDNNVVETQSLQQSNISADLYCLLLPLIEEIIELKVCLNFNEFTTSLNNFFQTLTPGDKDTILNQETKIKWHSQHEQYRNQYKFKPQLCRKSNELSIESRLSALRTNMVKECGPNQEDMSLVMEEQEVGFSSLDSRDR